MMSSDLKLSLFRQIDSLPENLLLELHAVINEFMSKKKKEIENGKKPNYQERLNELMELASQIEEKDDFDSYMKEFDKSRKDRPLPFREP